MSRGKARTDSTAHCPECGQKVHFQKRPFLGQLATCRRCLARLEVVEVTPLEVDWADEPAWDQSRRA